MSALGLLIDALIVLGVHLIAARWLGVRDLPPFRIFPSALAPPSPRARRLLVRWSGPIAVYVFLASCFFAVERAIGRSPTTIIVGEGTPAAQAGLRDGDRLVRFDGAEISTFEELAERVLETPRGPPIRIDFDRAGRTSSTTATLGPQGVLGVRTAGDRVATPVAAAIAGALTRPLTAFVAGARALHALVTRPSQPETVGGPIMFFQQPVTIIAPYAMEAAIYWPLFVLHAAIATILGERRRRNQRSA